MVQFFYYKLSIEGKFAVLPVPYIGSFATSVVSNFLPLWLHTLSASGGPMNCVDKTDCPDL